MGFLFVDRILEAGPVVRGIKSIRPADSYLIPDSTGRHCFIPSLIGETLGQLAAWQVMRHHDFTLRPVAGVAFRTTIHRPAYLGETLLLESTIENLDEAAVQYHGLATIGQEKVFSLEGAIGPLLPMSDFIDRDLVQAQFAKIYQPGPWPPQLTPVDTSAKLTAPTLLQFDKLIAHEPGVRIVAEKKVDAAAPYFADHFPNNPVLPMTVLLECAVQLAQTFMKEAYAKPYTISGLQRIKMKDFIKPGAIVTCQITVKEATEAYVILSCCCEVSDKRVCIAEIVLQPQEIGQ